MNTDAPTLDAPTTDAPQTRRRRIGPRQAEAMMDGPIDAAWYPVLRAHWRAYGPLAEAGIPRRVARVWCDRLDAAGFLETPPEDFVDPLPAVGDNPEPSPELRAWTAELQRLVAVANAAGAALDITRRRVLRSAVRASEDDAEAAARLAEVFPEAAPLRVSRLRGWLREVRLRTRPLMSSRTSPERRVRLEAEFQAAREALEAARTVWDEAWNRCDAFRRAPFASRPT